MIDTEILLVTTMSRECDFTGREGGEGRSRGEREEGVIVPGGKCVAEKVFILPSTFGTLLDPLDPHE